MPNSISTIRTYSHLFVAEFAQSFLAEHEISSEILQNGVFAGCFDVELRVHQNDFKESERLLNQLEQDGESKAGSTSDDN